MATTPFIQNGDVTHAANKEIINISANDNNILNYSRIFRINSSTPNQDTVIPISNYDPDITVSCSSESNSRSGKITINFVDTIILNPEVSIATIPFEVPFDHEPKVIISQCSAPAYNGANHPVYWAIGSVGQLDIYMDDTPTNGQSVSFYYIVEG